MPELTRFHFRGGTAVLTGAASGMGEEMAYGLASRGCGLVLLDRDAERLAAVADNIRQRHADLPLETHVIDLSDLDHLDRLTEQILADHPRITLLINNAGVAMGGTFEQVSAEEFDWVMRINFQAPLHLTRLLLPRLRQSPGSHIVSISSLFGLIAPPGHVPYTVSKFALRGLSDGLRHELAGHIGVTTVHPGGVRTRIAEDARTAVGVGESQAKKGRADFNRLLTYPADRAAERILTGVEKRQPRVVIALNAIVPDLIARIFPVTYWSKISRLSGSSRHVTHRSEADLVPTTSGSDKA